MKEPWVVHPHDENGRPFLEIGMNNRKLTRAFGLSCQGRAHFAATTLIQYLVKARNDKVDELIVAARKAEDPMADDDQSTKKAKPVAIKGRENAFKSANVPKVVELALPGFCASDGTCVGGINMNVLATSRVDVHVSVELADRHLEWMAEAIHVPWDVCNTPWAAKKRTRARADDADLAFPALTPPAKYVKRGKHTIGARYFDGTSQTWKTHTRTLGNHIGNMSAMALMDHVANIEASVLQYHQQRHVEPPNENEQEADVGGHQGNDDGWSDSDKDH